MQFTTKNNLLVLAFTLLIPSVFAQSNVVAPVNYSPTSERQEVVLQPEFPAQYVIELPIEDESKAKRKENFIRGLYLILIRASNDPQIINLPDIKEALLKPEIYVREFNYISKNLVPDRKSLFLQINFDAGSISRLLKRSSQTAWVKSKPSVLLWLAKDLGRNQILVNENSNGELINLVNEKSLEFGVPVVFPAWDMQDIKSIKNHDVCGYNVDAIKSASTRYGISWVAVACIKQPVLGTIWSSQWLLLYGDKTYHFTFRGVNVESIISQAMEKISQNIDDVALPVIRKDSVVVLRVSNVNGLNKYHEVIEYLRSFDAVTGVDLVNLNINDVKLKVKVIGGEQALLKTLSMQNRLVPDHDAKRLSSQADLDYKWVGLGHGSS